MTCIVGLVDSGKVFIGGDSAGVSGYNYRIREDSKVFANGDFIFGITTSFRMGQLLRYSLILPKQSANIGDYRFIVTDVVDSIKDCFKDNDFANVSHDVVSGGTFIIGYRGCLYTIFDDFQVAKSSIPFCSVGCGENYAMGAMDVLHKEHMYPKDKIIKTLETVTKYSNGVHPPFNIIDN